MLTIDLSGRVAVVTGGSGDLARVIGINTECAMQCLPVCGGHVMPAI